MNGLHGPVDVTKHKDCDVDTCGISWLIHRGFSPADGAGVDVERLATIFEARMPDGCYIMSDDGQRFSIVSPRSLAEQVAHLYRTGDVLSGLAALEGASDGTREGPSTVRSVPSSSSSGAPHDSRSPRTPG